jgi:hypothetical protein
VGSVGGDSRQVSRTYHVDRTGGPSNPQEAIEKAKPLGIATVFGRGDVSAWRISGLAAPGRSDTLLIATSALNGRAVTDASATPTIIASSTWAAGNGHTYVLVQFASGTAVDRTWDAARAEIVSLLGSGFDLATITT